MKYLDQAPPEAQKALLQALIKSITIYNDQVELKMYVGQPFEEIICSLPEVIHKNIDNAPKNGTTPQKTCGVTTSLALGANERPSWLPRLESNQDTQIQNLMSYRLDDRAIMKKSLKACYILPI